MPFNTLTFLVFFAVVFSVYNATKNWALKKWLLLGFSQIFYAAWNPPFIVLLWIVTFLNWCLARLIYKESNDARRKFYLTLSLSASLGLLGYLKYADFLLKNFVLLAAHWGVDYHPAPFNVILPLGISFYTFHALSYVIDLYRRHATETASFTDFALYVSFFPQLVAGPIVRASYFLPQLRSKKTATKDQLGWGLTLFIFGLFQKSVLADAILAPVVDQLYDHPSAASAWDAWLGILAFSGQIFFDFSGYSTCAIGLALCFGFRFPSNFHAPYGAIGFSDFWRRWHISLSSWLRDYLYVSFGGNRGSTFSVARALMLTMLIGGLWHGASWMFILWGFLHGLLLLAERYLRPYRHILQRNFSNAGLSIATFLVLTLTWIPFRSPDIGTAQAVWSAMFRAGFPSLLPGALLITLFVCVGLPLWQAASRNSEPMSWFKCLSPTLQGLVLGAGMLGIFLVSGGEPRGFIYFQF